VARGYFTVDFVRLTHERLQEMTGFRFDGVYYCPHGPDDGCRCRKPEPGMIEQAAAELGIDVASSYMIGDKPADIELAARAGMKGVLVTTGYGAETAGSANACIIADNIVEAARMIASGA
jgi:histidinol-phosphate phosphatase family protein